MRISGTKPSSVILMICLSNKTVWNAILTETQILQVLELSMLSIISLIQIESSLIEFVISLLELNMESLVFVIYVIVRNIHLQTT